MLHLNPFGCLTWHCLAFSYFSPAEALIYRHLCHLDIKSKKQVVSQPPKVANITLRQFTKDLPKTDRIKQV